MSIIGNAMGWMGNAWAGQDMADSFRQYQDYINQTTQKSDQNMNPFIQAGQGAIPQYQQWMSDYQKQMSGFNPANSIDDLMKNYKMSDYGKYMTQLATNQLNNQAAIGGTLGSGQNNRDVATMANQIGSEDLQNYLKNVFNQQNYGLNQNQLYSDALYKMMGLGEQGAASQNDFYKEMSRQMGEGMEGEGQATGYRDKSLFNIFAQY